MPALLFRLNHSCVQHSLWKPILLQGPLEEPCFANLKLLRPGPWSIIVGNSALLGRISQHQQQWKSADWRTNRANCSSSVYFCNVTPVSCALFSFMHFNSNAYAYRKVACVCVLYCWSSEHWVLSTLMLRLALSLSSRVVLRSWAQVPPWTRDMFTESQSEVLFALKFFHKMWYQPLLAEQTLKT